MAERIRGNPLALGAYSGPSAEHHCTASTGNDGGDCTPAQLAADDLYHWERSLRMNLPNGEWRIQVNAEALPPIYRLEVFWDEIGQSRMMHRIDVRVSRI